MEIRVLDALTGEQQEEIRKLNALCNAADGLEGKVFLSTELNYNKKIPAFYLGYEGTELAAFLMLFMPEREEAEVTAFTHPAWRRRGYFRRLCRTMEGVCAAGGIERLLFVINEKSTTGRRTLESIDGIQYQFSEFQMELVQKPALSLPEKIWFKEIGEGDTELYYELAFRALELGNGSQEFLNAVLHNSLRHGYIQFVEDKAVGMFHLNCEVGETCIYGLGILPEERGAGLGDMMVKYAAGQAAEFGQPVVLEVDSENAAAFHLYEKNGFRVAEQMNYYGMELGRSSRFIKDDF